MRSMCYVKYAYRKAMASGRWGKQLGRQRPQRLEKRCGVGSRPFAFVGRRRRALRQPRRVLLHGPRRPACRRRRRASSRRLARRAAAAKASLSLMSAAPLPRAFSERQQCFESKSKRDATRQTVIILRSGSQAITQVLFPVTCWQQVLWQSA